MPQIAKLSGNRGHVSHGGRRMTVTCQASQSTTGAIGKRKLGKSDVVVSEIGVGAWSWGDRSNYWQGWTKDGSREAYSEAMNAGCTFIDTAEVYGFGLSEEFIGEFMKTCSTPSKPSIGTKYAPLPWRQTAGAVVQACDASLKRLGVEQVDLYIQHWPGFFLNAFSNKATLEGLLQCQQQGKTRAVGVSNFNQQRVRDAATFFEANGTCLSSNQVQYSLLYREPERNGVLEACREKGVTLVAYSPLCQGLLSTKYSAGNIPKGPRSMYFTDSRFSKVSVLLDLLRQISKDSYNGEKSPSQIAINWLLCKDVLPIPGAKSGEQVKELVGACGWRLTDGEVEELDRISQNIPSSTGAPFEKW